MNRSTIDQLDRDIRAKSSGTSLRSHLAVAGQVAATLLQAADVPSGSRVLMAAASLHDIGKATEQFQSYLDRQRAFVCHEDDAPSRIPEFLADHASQDWLLEVTDGGVSLPITPQEIDDVIALAVTHHGRRYYAPPPDGGGSVRPTIATNSPEAAGRALTEFDLLFRYQPIGGVVILADQIASALQDGKDGLIVSVDPIARGAASPWADLPDEPEPEAELPDPQLRPFGHGLQRLLLDGMGITRVEARSLPDGWQLILDGEVARRIRSVI